MAKVRFIHTSDLHLDTPFKGLTKWNAELAEKLKDATFRSFKKVIDLCISEEVDFLIVSGDIFDSEQKSLAAQLSFTRELKRLSEKNIQAYFICGNHDPLSSWNDHNKLPGNTYKFNASQVEMVTHEKEGRQIADIYGISYDKKEEKRNLALQYNKSTSPSPISIAILHGSIGNVGAHQNYAPFNLDDINAKGFDYWALGHIHNFQMIKEAHPAIVYSGNPQGRDFGETGQKGCCLVEIAEGQEPEISFFSTHLSRFEELEINFSAAESIDELSGLISTKIKDLPEYSQQTNYILRIVLTGRTHLHKELSQPGSIDSLLEFLNEGQLLNEHFTWIDKIDLQTTSTINEEEIKAETSFAADILRAFDMYKNEDELEALLKEEGDGLAIQQAHQELSELSKEEKHQIIEDAKRLLLDKLIKEES